MKKAFWKIAPFGDFAFRSAQYDQLILGVDVVDYSPLRTALLERFKNKGWVTIETIEHDALTLLAAGADFAAMCEVLVNARGETDGIALAGAMLGEWFQDGLISEITAG